MKIREVKHMRWSGSTPDAEEIQKVINNKQEEGLEVANTEYEIMYNTQSGIREYNLMIYFKEETSDEHTIDLEDEYGFETTEQLEKQLDDDLL